MNGTEQREHTRAVDVLNARLTNAETVLTAVDERVAQAVALLERKINDEHAHRLKLADEQRDYVDHEDRRLRETCQARWDATADTTRRLSLEFCRHQHMTFWQRIGWILRGAR